MKFKIWLEQNEEWDWPYWLKIARGYGQSQGQYAFGPSDTETPAGDCGYNVDWELEWGDFPAGVEDVLKEGDALVQADYSKVWSYHECYYTVDVWVISQHTDANETLKAILGDDFDRGPEPAAKDGNSKGSITFPFRGFEEAIRELPNKLPDGVNLPDESFPDKQIQHKYGPEPGESREEYWSRILRQSDHEAFTRRPLEGD